MSSRFFRLNTICICFLLILSAVYRVAGSEPINISILSFNVKTNAFRPPAALTSFTDVYRKALTQKTGVRVLERENLSDITSEIALGQSGFLKKNSAALDSGSFEGVDYIVGGAISELNDGIYRVTISIREVSSAQIITESIRADIVTYGNQASEVLAHNTFHIITGEDSPIQKKFIPKRGAAIVLGLAVGSAVAGGFLRYYGDLTFQDYKNGEAPLDEFDKQFNKAQLLTTSGEVTLGISGAFAFTSLGLIAAKRQARTIYRD